MRPIYYIVFFVLVLSAACGKKDKPPTNDPPITPIVEVPVEEFKCQDLPLPVESFEWIDSTGVGDKNINAFLFDPINPDNLILVVNGDGFGYNKLQIYNIPTKTVKLLGVLGEFLPQINNKGWITFSDVLNNIHVVKENRDSVIDITTNMHSRNPQWDYTGTFIYYFIEGYFNVPDKLVRVDLNMNYSLDMEAQLPYMATFKKKDKLLSLKTNGNTCDLILTDFENQGNNRVLLNGPTYSKPGQINFDNLTLDKTDENFYWSNSNGIFKCNLASLKIDTVFKNCENSIHDNPIISFVDNELTYSHHRITPISAFVLHHEYKAMELNIATRKSSEIKVFP